MSGMLSINRNYEDDRAITVVVVPIGENNLFDKHFNVVSRCKEMLTIELNRPSDWKATSSPFQLFRWNAGNILFDYQRYDRFGNGVGELDNFQSSRRVLVAIGLINYPELGNSASRIEDDLEFFCRRFPNVILRRLFVFNFSFDEGIGAMPVISKGDPSSLVIFPPEMECEGGNMIDVHLQEVMGNVAVNVILSLERQMIQCLECIDKNTKLSASLQLITPFDEVEDSQNDPLRKNRKKITARLRKWAGDLSMQVCSPGDAIDHYAIAINECRNTSDIAWVAGSLEGYASSILLMLQLDMSPETFLGQNLKVITGMTIEACAIRLVEEKVLEALSLYSKSPSYKILEIECAMRVARIHSLDTWNDREQRVMESILRTVSIPDLEVQQQVDVLLESALLCRSIGMKRKYAWLLYLASLQLLEGDGNSNNSSTTNNNNSTSNNNNNTSSNNTATADSQQNRQQKAFSLLQVTSIQYGIEWTSIAQETTTPSPPTIHACNKEDSHQYVMSKRPQSSWSGMRRVLLAQLSHLSREHSDSATVGNYMAALLRLAVEHEGAKMGSQQQQQQQQRLKAAVGGSLTPQHSIGGIGVCTPTTAVAAGTATGTVPVSGPPDDQSSPQSRPKMSLHDALGGLALTHNKPGAILTLEDAVFKKHSQYLIQAAAASGYQSGIFGDNMSNVESDEGGGGGAASAVSLRDKDRDSVSNAGDGSGNGNGSGIRGRDRKSMMGGGGSVSKSRFLQSLGGGGGGNKRRLRLDIFRAGGITASSDSPVLCGVGSEFTVEEQEQSLRSFENVCKLLSPSCRLLLSGLPVVLSVRPKLLTGSVLPRKHKFIVRNPKNELGVPSSSSSTSASALFYDPFAARAMKKKEEESLVEVLWPSKVTANVSVVLRNILSVPVRMTNVSVAIEEEGIGCGSGSGRGSNYFLTPINILIPPLVPFYEVILNIKPNIPGNLKIIGLSYQINNASYHAVVESNGLKTSIPSEIAEPWQYPRKVSNTKLIEEIEKRKTTRYPGAANTSIVITPPGAPLRLYPNWHGAVLELYVGESRVEEVVVENPSLEEDVLDMRIGVQLKTPGSGSVSGSSTSTGSSAGTYDVLPYSGVCSEQNSTSTSTLNSRNIKNSNVSITTDFHHPMNTNEIKRIVIDKNRGKVRIPFTFRTPIDMDRIMNISNTWTCSQQLSLKFDSVTDGDLVLLDAESKLCQPVYFHREVLQLRINVRAGVWIESINVKGLQQNLQDAEWRESHMQYLNKFLQSDNENSKIPDIRILPIECFRSAIEAIRKIEQPPVSFSVQFMNGKEHSLLTEATKGEVVHCGDVSEDGGDVSISSTFPSSYCATCSCLEFNEIIVNINTENIKNKLKSQLELRQCDIEIVIVILPYYNDNNNNDHNNVEYNDDIDYGIESLEEKEDSNNNNKDITNENDYIVIGHTRKILTVTANSEPPTGGLEGVGVEEGECSQEFDYNIHEHIHKLSICFIRARTYAIYTFIREVTKTTVASSQNGEQQQQHWWTQPAPLIISSRHCA
eukprot:gene2057-4019_t